jgi:uncharacterized membrane protein
MRKTITYSSFVIASLAVVVAFVTARSYIQLAIAALLYPLLVYFAFKVLPHKIWKAPVITIRYPLKSAKKVEEETAKTKREAVEIADVDKRTFLKLVGATGLSFFLFSLLGQRVESLLFGRAIESGITGLGKTANGTDAAGALPTSGYRISEIDDSDDTTYYGFINADNGWFIMKEDSETSSFRYAKGDSNFPSNWDSRENLKYDYFYNVF